MNPELQALEKMLQMGLKSKADLAGLDEQHATASALRDTPDYKGNSLGQQSIFGHLANTVQKNTGKRQLKELAGQREAARANVANTASALPMFKLQQEQKAIELAAKNRLEDRDWATEDASKLAAAKAKELADKEKIRLEKEGQTATDFTQMIDREGNTVNVSRRHDGQWINGLKEPIDIQGLTEVPKVTITSDNSGYKSDAANKRAEEYINALGAANRVRGLYNDLSPEKLKQLSSIPTRVTKTFINALPENVAGLINQQFETDPQAKRYFSELAKMTAVERHAMFGGALTEYEGMTAGQFLAFVINMTPAEQQARMRGSVESGLQALKTSDAIQGGKGSTKYQDAYNNMNFKNLVYDDPIPQAGSVNAVNNSELIQGIDAEMAALQAELNAMGVDE